MLRNFFIAFFLGALAIAALAGFRGLRSPKSPLEIFPDMKNQPKFDPQHPSGFFADGRSARVPVAGTVPIGYELEGAYLQNAASNSKAVKNASGFGGGVDYYSTGKIGDAYGDGFPVDVTPVLLQRGQERFNIYCAPCHSQTADGNGIVKQLGLTTVANLQDPRIQTMPDGQIFNTITLGKNTMGGYGGVVAVEDRWAIVAYLHALHRSQNAKIDDVPKDQRAALENPEPKK
jgi:mono/diheme cytochrome c family protein